MSTAAFPAQYAVRRSLPRLSRYVTFATIAIADVVALSAAGVGAVSIRALFHAQYAIADWKNFFPSIFIFLFVFAWSGLYPGVASNPITEFRLILRASSIAFMLLIMSTVLLREGMLSSRVVFVLAWLLTIMFVPSMRRLIRGLAAGHTWWGVPTVVLGESEAALMMFKLLEGHPRLGLRPVALLLEPSSVFPLTSDMPAGTYIGTLEDAKHFSAINGDCYAVLAMPKTGSERLKELLDSFGDLYRNILIIPDLFGVRSLSVSAKDVCGVLALEVNQTLTLRIPQFFKRIFDLCVAGTVVILLSPLFIILYLAIKCCSPGPAFYFQPRIGRNQERFRLIKFRSMVVNADEVLHQYLASNDNLCAEWALDQKLKKDPRVTVIGRLLRKTSLDELPQLWNVLRGDMSLVGPRPIVESEIAKYGVIYHQYHRVTPGVTGLWQISGRNNTTYAMRIRLDDYYVRNWSLSLDIYILFRTLKTILFTEGAY